MPVPKFSDIKLKAVIVGVIVDNAGTLLIMTFLAATLVSTGLSQDEVMRRLKSTNGLLLGLIIGLSFTVLGGFFAGRMAGRAERLHGALVAVIGIILAVVFRESGSPLWFDVVVIAAMLPAGMAGGYLAQKRRAGSNNNA
ncbi:MAG TPA: hypothetical protein VIX18_03385 [Nitrospirota bacterium]